MFVYTCINAFIDTVHIFDYVQKCFQTVFSLLPFWLAKETHIPCPLTPPHNHREREFEWNKRQSIFCSGSDSKCDNYTWGEKCILNVLRILFSSLRSKNNKEKHDQSRSTVVFWIRLGDFQVQSFQTILQSDLDVIWGDFYVADR